MKKLLITVILAAVCQFTFANTAFDHGRGEYRHHERGGYGYHESGGYGYHEHRYCRPHIYFRPVIIARPHICLAPRIWIGGQWIINQEGYQIWAPGHWTY